MAITTSRTTGGILPDGQQLTASRRRLFSMALQLFGERGYHAVSVRDITDALDQQPGAIYAHVSSKQQLLFELVKIGLEEHRDRLRAAVHAAGSDPVDQIRELVRAHVAVNLDYPALARMIAQETRSLDSEQREFALAVRAEAERTLTEVIEAGQRLGLFSETDTFLAVTAIGAIGIRAAEWWTPGAPRTRDEVAETYAQFALRLVCAAPQAPTPPVSD
ncbi:TetR/AcrR family transcriptional regulator [Myceligenerans xiligouense]|uniref:TetR family transcriptional regulator n=1 Tax=Myceligenerans xiligouense TaxID=253184 RepID=A0A3N4ZSD2_9MICO|nr:TetR/AcrR family transcriptional regulator [Myceligenerans xiligouense]RPF22651.1 TetR family transcriptional regulator [Myceligenerans xiligouense]